MSTITNPVPTMANIVPSVVSGWANVNTTSNIFYPTTSTTNNINSAITNLQLDLYNAVREIHFANETDKARIRLSNGKFVTVNGDGTLDYSFWGKSKLDTSKLIVEDGTQLMFSDGSVICVDRDGTISKESLINCNENFIDVSATNLTLYEYMAFSLFHQIAIPNDKLAECELTLPDGSKVIFTREGNLSVVDTSGVTVHQAKNTYGPPPRDFNKYMNSSDLLEEFVKYCGSQNISKDDFYNLPVTIFIYWLIVRAAETDKEDPGEAKKLLISAVKNEKTTKILNRCKNCGKFLSKKKVSHNVFFCSSEHLQAYLVEKDIE